MADTKATWETVVNTGAIVLTSGGAVSINSGRVLEGIALVCIGALLEFVKYSCRQFWNPRTPKP